MPLFTDAEKDILRSYVTSVDDDVFAVKNLAGIVGAVYARYSRAKTTFRETLLKEFVQEGIVDPAKADALIERVLIAFGDDSVGELEGAHASLENISMLATKEVEDARLGSYIEKSSRYVVFDQKDAEGRWPYYCGPELAGASFARQYADTMDALFTTYARLVEPMQEHFKQLKPIAEAAYDINGDGVKEREADCTTERDQKAFRTTYTMDVRTKACDTLRHLLPLSTRTNVGTFGNGRFHQGLISRLLTSDLPEAQTLGTKLAGATKELIPQYVRRAARSEYQVAVRSTMRALAGEFGVAATGDIPKTLPCVSLVEPVPGMPLHESHDVQTIAAMLYPFAEVSFATLVARVQAMSEAERLRIVRAYLGERKTRRDRPGRALEHGYTYTFELTDSWGVYKDLMRHRMLTLQRQPFTVRLGFYLAPELVDAGFADAVQGAVARAGELYEAMRAHDPALAQYAVLHGHYVRWMMGFNDREAFHLLELRTVPQGHPTYRRAAQEMHRLIAARSPWRAEAMQFVDYNDYYWSRADSEARQRAEEKKLDEKLEA